MTFEEWWGTNERLLLTWSTKDLFKLCWLASQNECLQELKGKIEMAIDERYLTKYLKKRPKKDFRLSGGRCKSLNFHAYRPNARAVRIFSRN